MAGVKGQAVWRESASALRYSDPSSIKIRIVKGSGTQQNPYTNHEQSITKEQYIQIMSILKGEEEALGHMYIDSIPQNYLSDTIDWSPVVNQQLVKEDGHLPFRSSVSVVAQIKDGVIIMESRPGWGRIYKSPSRDVEFMMSYENGTEDPVFLEMFFRGKQSLWVPKEDKK